VTERVDIDGLAVTLVDTAGWRSTSDVVEREGVARGEQARAVADLTLVVLDRSEPMTSEDAQLIADTTATPRLVVANKIDTAPAEEPSAPHADVAVSARTGAGIAALRAAIAGALTRGEPLRDGAGVSNVRHIALLEQARTALAAARGAAVADAPEEFVLSDLQAARARLDEIVGVRTSDDLLKHIFERFCIGK
jgi:tRNA modification GTPase